VELELESKSKSKFRPSSVSASLPGFQLNRQAQHAQFAECESCEIAPSAN